jgi:hypothetical protein
MTNTKNISLFLFTTSVAEAREAMENGVEGVIVDLEIRGKKLRQNGYPTEINEFTVSNIEVLRKALPQLYIITRINQWNATETPREIDEVIAAGTNEILLPMAKHPDEVVLTNKHINERVSLSMLIETKEMLEHLPALPKLPLKRIYIGLNDLSISCGYHNIFLPFIDGTLQHIFKQIDSTPYGVAGLTDPLKGSPIPCNLLLAAMVRLGVSFTFLRRSFLKDAGSSSIADVLAKIEMGNAQMKHTADDQHQLYQQEMSKIIESWRQFEPETAIV